VAATPPQPLGPRFLIPRFPGERRDPGTTERLDGSQKDIEPPQPPRHGGRRLFKRTRTPCQQKIRCDEVRSVAAALPRLLGPRFPIPRFPGERRDPGTTERWVAARRTLNHHSLRGTEGAVFSRELEHRASRKSAAMRFALWQRRYRGSWAPAFAGETKRGVNLNTVPAEYPPR